MVDRLKDLTDAVHGYLYAQLMVSPDPDQEAAYRRAELMARNRLIALHDAIVDELEDS